MKFGFMVITAGKKIRLRIVVLFLEFEGILGEIAKVTELILY